MYQYALSKYLKVYWFEKNVSLVHEILLTWHGFLSGSTQHMQPDYRQIYKQATLDSFAFISPFPLLTRFVGWLMLKVFASVFDNIQVDLNQLAPLQRASQEVQVSVNVLIHIPMECLLFTCH